MEIRIDPRAGVVKYAGTLPLRHVRVQRRHPPPHHVHHQAIGPHTGNAAHLIVPYHYSVYSSQNKVDNYETGCTKQGGNLF